ncbi:competence protein ComGB [Lactobacillus bombicola]|uniref:Competence protein ComGB n=1 Tax=Lactobacillus bombicola TaxID=1505723 RepID=A0A1I1SIW2_9LACO|nr:type II secretion system F family protein [Lactobacillus bombicola]SFD46376.1 competence protein ComGB [Lactobacillus bombicola]
MRKYLNNLRKDKLTQEQRLNFLDYLHHSLANGFSLNASLELMPILWPSRKNLIDKLYQKVQAGNKLSNLMLKLGFSKTVVTQIDLALEQGSLVECLSQLATLNRLKCEQEKKLKTELSYPFVLVVMMILLLFFMQTFVSNQFANSDEHTGDLMLLGLLFLSLGFVYYLIRVLMLLKKQDYHSLYKLAHYPVIGSLVKLYVKYLLIYDVGLLLASGFSLQKICEYAENQEQGSLQQFIGEKIASQLNSGKKLADIIVQEYFLPDELLLLLQVGSKKADLSQRCLLLGRTLFSDLTSDIEKLIVNVQPFCFILIGLCIIGMYLKLLLPMYAMMQNI